MKSTYHFTIHWHLKRPCALVIFGRVQNSSQRIVQCIGIIGIGSRPMSRFFWRWNPTSLDDAGNGLDWDLIGFLIETSQAWMNLPNLRLFPLNEFFKDLL